jgi:hypothetical protein
MAEPTVTAPMDDALLAPPNAACCAGACGPIFETPLLEQLFNRVRGRGLQPAHAGHTRNRPLGTERRRMDHR